MNYRPASMRQKRVRKSVRIIHVCNFLAPFMWGKDRGKLDEWKEIFPPRVLILI